MCLAPHYEEIHFFFDEAMTDNYRLAPHQEGIQFFFDKVSTNNYC